MNKLYFGDNLEILREMENGRVDIICTDPPFNSGRDYNTFLGDSLAQKKAFTDTWTWDTPAEEAREDIDQRALGCDTYRALDECLRGYDLILRRSVSGNKGAMRAYLAFMGPRLAEMHRILKDTGSIYLHCDPTASHYLKGLMDAIWDQDNRKKNEFFRNEIVWHYRRWTGASKQFQKMHDIILYYTKTNRYVFTKPLQRYANEGYIEDTVRGVVDGKLVRLKDEKGNYIKREKQKGGVLMHDIWSDINFIAPTAAERLGYPTQKPRALYERMIRASSNLGDLVLDPFCGCGTTIDAAHTLKRLWMGIDITILALDPMRQRLSDRHGLTPSVDYDIEGYPTNMQEVRKLVRDERKYHDFSNWAVTRLGLTPTQNVNDGGKDGIKRVVLWNARHGKEQQTRILAEVKSGAPTITQVRSFCHTMTENNATAGIFITIDPMTDGMRQIAANMGTFLHNKRTYPKLQFWQIDDDYFKDPNIVRRILPLPPDWIRPIRKSEQHFDDTQLEMNVD